MLGLDRSDRRLATGSQVVHVVSRTAGQEILFEDQDKETFHKILFKQLKFSGLRVIAWCFMGNHFHLLLEIPDKETALACLSEEDIVGRLSCFSEEFSTKLLLAEVADCRRLKNVAGVSRIAEKVGKRLFDLSMFMKELKLKMTLAYNFTHGRRGTLWEERFKSLVVAGDEAVRAVAAYIDLNPIRAGLVEKPEDIRWCSYAAAVGRDALGAFGDRFCGFLWEEDHLEAGFGSLSKVHVWNRTGGEGWGDAGWL